MQKTSLYGFLKSCLADFVEILFPNPCLCCTSDVRARNAAFCPSCLFDLPYTDHFTNPDNVVGYHFAGRLPLTRGAAVLYFTRGGLVQSMLHRLKYKKQREVGEVFGEMAADLWLEQEWGLPDVVVPIPIHRKKQLQRGYNQSAVFGASYAKKAGITCAENAVIKIRETVSQTGKTRDERVSNVKDVFSVTLPEQVEGKHVLIVDDVLTTGATIEACGIALLASGAAQLSVIVLAAAK